MAVGKSKHQEKENDPPPQQWSRTSLATASATAGQQQQLVESKKHVDELLAQMHEMSGRVRRRDDTIRELRHEAQETRARLRRKCAQLDEQHAIIQQVSFS